MKSQWDTIAAIATAPGEAGIAIVRISGPQSLVIADKVFRGKGPRPSERSPNTFLLGFIHSPFETDNEEDLDEVILLIYRAPHSYTREDVVEIQGHGGRTCARRILRAVMNAGARAAEPGEFTKRAFLNGRIDLLQAEAVADLIQARSQRAAAAALEQLDGRLSALFTATYDNLLEIAADLEATLDFPEEKLPVSTISAVMTRLEGVTRDLRDLLATWEEGNLLREGALVVISGRPNVGKSTLLNCLLGTDRAIVTDIAGTTRDTIEEQIVLDGVVLRLVDTAGLREPSCTIEREGVQRAQAYVEKADINLHVIDCSENLNVEDKGLLKTLELGKTVIVLNKSDLGQLVQPDNLGGFSAVVCSLIRGEGIPGLKEAILDKLGIEREVPSHAVISERHRQFIQNALNNLDEAVDLLSTGKEDVVVVSAGLVRNALESLGTITGRVYDDEMLESIFSRFCVGK